MISRITSKNQLILVVLMLAAPAAFAAPSLMLGKISAKAGTTAELPIQFDPGGKAISGLQFTLISQGDLIVQSLTPSSEIAGNGKVLSMKKNGSKTTVIIFGMNQNLIGKGEIIKARIPVAKGNSAKTLKLSLAKAVATDPKGRQIDVSSPGNGEIAVLP